MQMSKEDLTKHLLLFHAPLHNAGLPPAASRSHPAFARRIAIHEIGRRPALECGPAGVSVVREGDEMRTQIRPRGAVLPGQVTVENTLVDGLVVRVNQIHRERGLDLARRIGTVILTAFFRNQGSLFAAQAGHHMSFRSLAARDDLEISHATLYRYTAVEAQIRTMPSELAMALSLTHHVALLPIRDETERIGFARRARRERWSSRVLRQRIATERTATPRTGRPPLSMVAKASRGIHRALLSMRELPEHELGALDDAEIERLIEALNTVHGRLVRVKRASAW